MENKQTYKIEETAGLGTRIYVYRDGLARASMDISILTNPDGYKAKYSEDAYRNNLAILNASERAD